MILTGANIAIIKANQILLTKREDFEVWCFTPAENVESRKELYALRDRSGMSRSEFYKYYFESHTDNKFVRDIENKPTTK